MMSMTLGSKGFLYVLRNNHKNMINKVNDSLPNIMVKKFNECESMYTVIERLCCALVYGAKILGQCMLYYTTWLISKLDPLKYICKKPYLSNKITSVNGRIQYCLYDKEDRKKKQNCRSFSK
jgi:hypothetical protein